MKWTYSAGACVAAAVALNMAAFAQTTESAPKPSAPAQQSAPKPAPPAQAQASGDQQVTLTGCIQREADYRKASGAGGGGVAGTGVGTGNEFVLTMASTGGAPGTAGTTGTAGSAAGSMAYELTGSNEGQAAKFVGQRVEIMGKLKAAEVSAGGQPTGGPTAGKPPSGVDLTSKDLQLRELEVGSIRMVPGTCSAQ
jgi:hypothetical protein